MKYGTLLLLIVISVSVVHSQTIPPDKESLEKSEGAGMAFYADMNGYPGPKHILEMEDKLKLSEEQVKDIQAIFDAMQENGRTKGEAIIAKEIELEELFSSSKATEADAKRISREIGTLRGELRAVHLVAHVQARQVLTKEQVATYTSIRNATRQHTHGK